MIHYDYYADAPEDAIEELLRSSFLCRLVTVGDGRTPHIGLYPFAPTPDGFELHLHRADEQIADLRENPRCALEVDEALSAIPSDWVDAENGSFATAYHRTVTFECEATLSDDPEVVAAQQNRLLSRYQPEASPRPVLADDPMYRGMVRLLVSVRLVTSTRKVKFKLGQNRDFQTRAAIVSRLRERGTELDRRSADALEWTIELGWTTQGRRRGAK